MKKFSYERKKFEIVANEQVVVGSGSSEFVWLKIHHLKWEELTWNCANKKNTSHHIQWRKSPSENSSNELKKEKLRVAHPIRVFSSWGITILIFTFISGRERESQERALETRRGKLREGEQTSHPTKARLETPKIKVESSNARERRKMLCKSVLWRRINKLQRVKELDQFRDLLYN